MPESNKDSEKNRRYAKAKKSHAERLGARQEAFVEYYCQDPKRDAKAAALLAGYSKSYAATASTLLKNPKIRERIELRLGETGEEEDVTPEWILKQHRKVYERCMQSSPVYDHKGNFTGEYQFNASGAERALENMQRYTGGFVDRGEIDHKSSELRTLMERFSGATLGPPKTREIDVTPDQGKEDD